jgi:Tfp pilus assembly protein PilF
MCRPCPWTVPALAIFCAIPAAFAVGREQLFEITGSVEPPVEASVSISGANEPFAAATLADAAGRFHFAKLRPGAYTLAAMAPGYGEARITIEAGTGTADAKGRVRATIRISEAEKADLARRHSVSARELAIPESAARDYREAQKALARRDAEGARKSLEHAVAAAPGFAGAWNTLGTIAYQKGEFERAARCFQKALEANPAAYEPLVNMGGVLINLNRLDAARGYNQHAVLLRPNDALANSQLGITFFELGQDAAAEKYLRRACQLDPAHFSHPQLVLAQIHIRQNRRPEAAADLEQFLHFHPDAANAPELRRDIATLRQAGR